MQTRIGRCKESVANILEFLSPERVSVDMYNFFWDVIVMVVNETKEEEEEEEKRGLHRLGRH